eukprot:scaffold148092_cov23-Prasinocladus_malaysianus.AAC.1
MQYICLLQEAERRRQEEAAMQRARAQAAQEKLLAARRAEWLEAAVAACPPNAIPLTDPTVTFTPPLPQLPPQFQDHPERLVTVAISLTEVSGPTDCALCRIHVDRRQISPN